MLFSRCCDVGLVGSPSLLEEKSTLLCLSDDLAPRLVGWLAQSWQLTNGAGAGLRPAPTQSSSNVRDRCWCVVPIPQQSSSPQVFRIVFPYFPSTARSSRNNFPFSLFAIPRVPVITMKYNRQFNFLVTVIAFHVIFPTTTRTRRVLWVAMRTRRRKVELFSGCFFCALFPEKLMLLRCHHHHHDLFLLFSTFP